MVGTYRIGTGLDHRVRSDRLRAESVRADRVKLTGFVNDLCMRSKLGVRGSDAIALPPLPPLL